MGFVYCKKSVQLSIKIFCNAGFGFKDQTLLLPVGLILETVVCINLVDKISQERKTILSIYE